MNLTIDSNIQNILFRLGGVDYPVSILKFSQNGTEAETVWGGNTPSEPNYVLEVKMEYPQQLQATWHNIWFETGIELPYAQDLWTEVTLTKYQNCGDSVCGLTNNDPYISGSYNNPEYFYRMFFYQNYIYFDYYNNRKSNFYIGNGTTATIEFGKDSNTKSVIKYNGNTSTGGYMSSYNYNGQTYKIFLGSVGIRRCKVWSDYTKTTLLFDGAAALDENDVPCLYDSVSASYKYLQNPNGYTSFGDITYLIGVSLSLSSNDTSMGTVSGGGTYATGDYVTCYANRTSAAYIFTGWYDTNNNLVSSDATYSFYISSDTTLQARFAANTAYTVTVSSNDTSMGTVSGGGTYYYGETVSLVASAESGNHFVGWYSGGMLYSTNTTYTFTVSGNVTFIGTFEANSGAYTPVSYIKYGNGMTNWYSCYIDTGINTPSSGVLVAEMQYVATGNSGTVIFGHCGGTIGSSDDSRDCRIFNYGGDILVDVGNGRGNRGGYYNQLLNYTWTIDTTNKSTSLVDNTNNSTLFNYTFSTNPNSYPFYVILDGYSKIKSLTLTLNNTIVFNGVAALDNNNTPCLYDSVTGNCFYAQGTHAANVTYES